MDQKVVKLLESPAGQGEIYQKKEFIAQIFYNLRVSRAFMQGGPDGKNQPTPMETAGKVEISGTVTVSQQERMKPELTTQLSSGETLTLFLNDGRKLDVVIAKGDPFSGIYEVSTARRSGFYR